MANSLEMTGGNLVTNRVLALSIAGLVLAGAASAATVKKLTLKNLVDVSTVIFQGVVKAQSSQRRDSPLQIHTQTVFQVNKVLKGAQRSSYTLTQLGGVHGEGAQRIVQQVPGYARFKVGERVLIFLEPTTTGRLVVTGLAQGKFTLAEDPTFPGRLLATRSFHGLHFEGGGGRTVVLEGQPDNGRTFPMSQLLDVIDGRRPNREPLKLRLKGHFPPASPTVPTTTGAGR